MNVRVALIGEHQLTLLGLAQLVKGAPQMEMAGILVRSDGVVERAERAGAQAAVLDVPRADETQALAWRATLAYPPLLAGTQRASRYAYCLAHH